MKKIKTSRYLSSTPLLFGVIVSMSLLYGTIFMINNTSEKNQIDLISQPDNVSFQIDFLDMQPVNSYVGNDFSRLYFQNKEAYVDVPKVASTNLPNGFTFGIPFDIPTDNNYKVDFDATIVKSSDYNVWIRLITNYSDVGQYTISIHPATTSYEIRKTENNISNIISTGKSSAIQKNENLNHVSVVRVLNSGELVVYINNVKVAAIVDKTFTRGTNRMSVTNYSNSDASVKISKLIVTLSNDRFSKKQTVAK